MSSFFKPRVYRTLCTFVFIPVLFLSCIGSSAQIKLNSDGSGTFTQEIRISSELMELGELDGNADQLPVPLGKEDLERTVDRIPGLRLLSYSSQEDGKDMIFRAEYAFDSPEALEALFSSNDQDFKIDMKEKRIRMTFPETESVGSEFMEMMASMFEGYEFSTSFLVPGKAAVAWFDEDGKKIQKFPGSCSVKDKTVDYTVTMTDMVYLDSPLTLEVSW